MKSSRTFGIIIFIIVMSVFCVIGRGWVVPFEEGTTAYMTFTVAEVKDDEVLVEDYDGNSWWFSKPEFKCHPELLVVVKARMYYTDDGTKEGYWKWELDSSLLIAREYK